MRGWISPDQPASAHVTGVGDWVGVLLPWVGQGQHMGAAPFSVTAKRPCAVLKSLLGEVQNSVKQLKFGGFP